MKLFCYSDRSQQGYAQKYLLASLARHNEFDVVYETHDSNDDHPVLLAKAKRVLAFAERAKASGETSFVWADNDIVVLKPFRDRLLSLLAPYDVVFQSTGGYLCGGFFAAKLNDVFMNYYRAVVNESKCYTIVGGTGDQHACDLLKKMVRMTLLPEAEFWSPFGQVPHESARDTWLPSVPKSALLVHMCNIQYPYKLKALDYCLTL